jgi:hypothetical protein
MHRDDHDLFVEQDIDDGVLKAVEEKTPHVEARDAAKKAVDSLGKTDSVMAYDIAALWAEAEGGSAPAQVALGVLLLEGNELPQNYLEAHRWFSEAARQGVPRARYHLGRMYALGLGVSRDVPVARSLFEAACERGEFLAHIELARLELSLGRIEESGRAYMAALKLQRRVDAPDEIEEARRFVAVHPARGSAAQAWRLSHVRQPLAVATVNAVTWWNNAFTAALLISCLIAEGSIDKVGKLLWTAWFGLTPVLALLALVLIWRHPGTRGRAENIAILGVWVVASSIALFVYR